MEQVINLIKDYMYIDFDTELIRNLIDADMPIFSITLLKEKYPLTTPYCMFMNRIFIEKILNEYCNIKFGKSFKTLPFTEDEFFEKIYARCNTLSTPLEAKTVMPQIVIECISDYDTQLSQEMSKVTIIGRFKKWVELRNWRQNI